MDAFFRKFKYLDLPLLMAIFLLSFAGCALLYSTSYSSEVLNIFWRQVIFLGLGWLLFIFFCFFDYHTLAKNQRWYYVLLLIGLIYVLFFGQTVRGGNRWINLWIFNFQPAEFAKIVCILGISRILYLNRGGINSLLTLFKTLLYILIPVILVLLEPDFGSALVILGICLLSLLISPINKKHIALLIALGLIFSGFSWKFILKDFQKSRILVFLNPARDLRGEGYNVRQAVVAVGSGKIFGKGLALGSQSQNRFLPERQTDFIFAASAEQVGLLGSLTLLILFFILEWRLIKIMRSAKDDLGFFLVGGTYFLFLIHILINIGMNIGLLPVTGIPLPFLSAGGSFFLTIMIALGISQNISLQSKILRF